MPAEAWIPPDSNRKFAKNRLKPVTMTEKPLELVMHGAAKNTNLIHAFFTFWELVYHSVVRQVRTSSGSASLGLLSELTQTLIMFGMFYIIMIFMSMGGIALRGDPVLFVLTGVLLFMMHNQAIAKVMGAGNPTSPIMKHRPMTTMVAILSASIAQLYLQILGMGLILVIVHVLRGGLEILNPAGLVVPVLLAWGSGVAIGLLFLVAKPFAPNLVPVISQVYRRANMITSGKMMPANLMPAGMLPWFDWNPLFHCIDQARGATFVNYYPRNSNLEYPLYFIAVALLIGLMVEHWLRRNMSLSWGKG